MSRKRYRPLADIPASVTKDRISIIVDHVRGKTALDIGCTGTKAGVSHLRYRYLHHHLAEAAGEILGIDIDGEAIAAMKAEGFNVEVGDAENLNLNRKFQVIVAGEIIEHLANPGIFLENVRRHLEDDGTFLITTPNPFNINQVWKILKYNQIKVHGEHTCWICPTVLKQLMERYGMRMKHLYWIRDPGWYLPKFWLSLLRPYWTASFLSVVEKIT